MTRPPPHRAEQLKVALLQTAPLLGQVDANLADLDGLISSLPEVDLAVAPELATHGYHIGALDSVAPLAGDDERLRWLGRHGPAAVVGFAESSREHRYNSAAIVDGKKIVAVQRKLFLPTYRDWQEHKYFRSGGTLRCIDVRGTRIAVLICNDLWQPPLPWLAAHDGAEVLVVIANSVQSRAAVPVATAWTLLLAHTAVTLQCYVVFVNRSATDEGRNFWGGSRVVAPDGSTDGLLGEEAGQSEVSLDLLAVRSLRAEWPLLNLSRFDLIAREAARLADSQD